MSINILRWYVNIMLGVSSALILSISRNVIQQNGRCLAIAIHILKTTQVQKWLVQCLCYYLSKRLKQIKNGESSKLSLLRIRCNRKNTRNSNVKMFFSQFNKFVTGIVFPL